MYPSGVTVTQASLRRYKEALEDANKVNAATHSSYLVVLDNVSVSLPKSTLNFQKHTQRSLKNNHFR